MLRHSYSSIYFHLVWSTKNKRPYIKSEFKKDLYSFIGKTIIMKGWHPIAINGIEDHIHILIQLFPNCKILDVIANIKASSSFAWQALRYNFSAKNHSG